MWRKFNAFCGGRRQFQEFKQARSKGILSTSAARIVFDAACASDARILCNTDSTDADFLAAELEDFFNSFPPSFEEQVKARKLSGEKIKFVSKKRLQKIVTEQVKIFSEINTKSVELTKAIGQHSTSSVTIGCCKRSLILGASLDTSKACLDIGITFVLRKELRIP